MTCNNCGSTDVTDHSAYGVPGGYRYYCTVCQYLWGKYNVEDTYETITASIEEQDTFHSEEYAE